MITIPQEIRERLKSHCETNNLDFSEIVASDFNILIVGTKEFGFNEVCILAAHLLLEGVISNRWNESNNDIKSDKVI